MRRILPNGDEAWFLKLVCPTRISMDYLNDICGMAIKVEGSAEMRMHGSRSKLFFKQGWKASNSPEGRTCSWSSAGPTFDERMKPDVCAPGYYIFAAGNSNLMQKEIPSESKYFVEHFDYDGRSYPIMGISGTSMATPVVTGTVALWLQADPTLTPNRIREVIAATAKHPDPTLTYPNTIYGNGEIDAYAGLLKILNITSVTNLSTQD